MVSDVLPPGVVSLLRARVEELADDPAHDTLVVASPYTKHVLVSGVRPLKVKTLDEVVASVSRERGGRGGEWEHR